MCSLLEEGGCSEYCNYPNINELATSSVMHGMANHYVMIDGADSVYMHLHLYHTLMYYHTLRINSNLTSTSSIIIIIRHNLITDRFGSLPHTRKKGVSAIVRFGVTQQLPSTWFMYLSQLVGCFSQSFLSVGFRYLVKYLQFPIALRVIQCRDDTIDTELLENVIHQLVLKLSSIVQ